jgi:hypothetical protein
MRIVRGILGFLAGYAVVVLTTEFGFRLLPQRPIHHESALVVAAAAVVAITAGVAGGGLAAWIARSRTAGLVVLVPLLAETIWLLFFRPSDWRDAVAALTLLACVAAGALIFGRRSLHPPPSPQPPSSTAPRAAS